MCACRYLLEFTSMPVKNMQVCKYESMHVCKYWNTQVSKCASMHDSINARYKYSRIQVHKYVFFQVCAQKYTNMQVWRCMYAIMDYDIK